jgi:hypothetical protein
MSDVAPDEERELAEEPMDEEAVSDTAPRRPEPRLDADDADLAESDQVVADPDEPPPS